MGRTALTARMAVDSTEQKWKGYRRVLRPRDREAFDKLFDLARKHGDASTMLTIPHSIEVVFMSVLLEMLKRIEELEEKVGNNC